MYQQSSSTMLVVFGDAGVMQAYAMPHWILTASYRLPGATSNSELISSVSDDAKGVNVFAGVGMTNAPDKIILALQTPPRVIQLPFTAAAGK
jgi:hypothetical protein